MPNYTFYVPLEIHNLILSWPEGERSRMIQQAIEVAYMDKNKK